MVNPKDNFREAVDRVIWAHSNLSTEDRAEVLREYVEALEADESRYDDSEEHVRHTLASLGFELPEDGLE